MTAVLHSQTVAGPRLPDQSCSAVGCGDDVALFGIDAARALSELPQRIATLNRTYRHLVEQRRLLTLPGLNEWLGRPVNVFLRHDVVFVFAIHHDGLVGMANCVGLKDATFVVDQIGRQQTLRKTGTLPNLSTVHAFVSGRLIRIEQTAPDLDLSTWHPVVYRPDLSQHFLTTSSPGDPTNHSSPEFQPVTSAAQVLMIPGRVKVWCQGISGSSNSATGELKHSREDSR